LTAGEIETSMRLLLGFLFRFAVAAVFGLGLTQFALTRGTAFGAITIGAWTAWPKTGTADIDPYARAAIARSGELPIGSGDGVAFFASSDDSGRRSTGAARDALRHHAGRALLDRDAVRSRRPPGSERGDRYGFTSQEIARRSDGSFEIAVSARARPGNWLPTGGIDRFVVVLRLYDTPVGVATARRKMPRCRSSARQAAHDPLGAVVARGLLLGGIVHLSSVLLLPRTATQDAYTRLAAAVPANTIMALPRPEPDDCRAAVHGSGFRHRGVPLRPCWRPAQAARAGEPGLYVGVVLFPQRRRLLRHQRPRRRRRVIELDLMTTQQRAALPEDEEVTAADRLIVESPTPAGLIMVRAFGPEPGLMPMARRALASAQCRQQG
jgi:uncharacterized membrane protein